VDRDDQPLDAAREAPAFSRPQHDLGRIDRQARDGARKDGVADHDHVVVPGALERDRHQPAERGRRRVEQQAVRYERAGHGELGHRAVAAILHRDRCEWNRGACNLDRRWCHLEAHRRVEIAITLAVDLDAQAPLRSAERHPEPLALGIGQAVDRCLARQHLRAAVEIDGGHAHVSHERRGDRLEDERPVAGRRIADRLTFDRVALAPLGRTRFATDLFAIDAEQMQRMSDEHCFDLGRRRARGVEQERDRRAVLGEEAEVGEVRSALGEHGGRQLQAGEGSPGGELDRRAVREECADVGDRLRGARGREEESEEGREGGSTHDAAPSIGDFRNTKR
jgi:hypothetical protein